MGGDKKMYSTAAHLKFCWRTKVVSKQFFHVMFLLLSSLFKTPRMPRSPKGPEVAEKPVWCADLRVGNINHHFLVIQNWLAVSNIFYFYPYLGKISNLTNIFQMGWNHQLENCWVLPKATVVEALKGWRCGVRLFGDCEKIPRGSFSPIDLTTPLKG